MRFVVLLVLLAGAAHASPFGGSAATGVVRFDGFNARRGGGGTGVGFVLGVNLPIRRGLDAGLRFDYALLAMEEIDRTGRVLHFGAGAELDVTDRLSFGLGAG